MSTTKTYISVERTAHSYPGSLYLLPSDEEEHRRLLAQHQLYTRLLSDRLIIPPISFSEGNKILDIGTGACLWLCDVRARIPEAVQIYGIDIESRLFPSYTTLSPNVHLSICSGTSLPSHWASTFTLVNQRLLIFAYTRDQWQRNINEMYRVLAPGGYAQLIEIGPEWVSGPKTASYVLFIDEFTGRMEMLVRCGVYIADMLKVAGFVDVKREEVMMKLGKWAEKDGVQGRDVVMGACRGLRDSVMKADQSGRFASVGEFDKAMDEIEEEWDNTEGSYAAVRAFYGRKPV